MIDQDLRNAFSRVFNLDQSQITIHTSADDVPAWDSLGHLRLILELESTYNVRFLSEEIPTLTSVERIQNCLQRHKAI
jgi:acyl carrier protein